MDAFDSSMHGNWKKSGALGANGPVKEEFRALGDISMHGPFPHLLLQLQVLGMGITLGPLTYPLRSVRPTSPSLNTRQASANIRRSSFPLYHRRAVAPSKVGVGPGTALVMSLLVVIGTLIPLIENNLDDAGSPAALVTVLGLVFAVSGFVTSGMRPGETSDG